MLTVDPVAVPSASQKEYHVGRSYKSRTATLVTKHMG